MFLNKISFAGLIAVWVVAFLGMAQAQNCGSTDQACEVDDGVYHIALPEVDEGAPVVLYLHGSGGSGAAALRNTDFHATFTDRGYAFIGASGQPGFDGATRLDWDVADGHPRPRDDTAYLDRVLDDAVARFGLDADRVLMIGFSRGASMVWDYACAQPGRVRGFATVAGAFWEPLVTTCAAPVHLLHTQGFADRMVPFEGRKVTWQGIDFHQGSVMKGLEVWRQVNGCMGAAEDNEAKGDLWSKTWTGCGAGSLGLILSPGGHGIPKGWSGRVLDWFETR